MRADDHRRFAVEAFNRSWDLLEEHGRDPEADADALAAAFASRWHWSHVGTADHVGLGDHQISKVAAAVGLPDLSLRFARRAWNTADTEGWTGWRRAIACEGMARAHHVAGQAALRDRWLRRAAEALAAEAEAESRKVVEDQLAELPGWPVDLP